MRREENMGERDEKDIEGRRRPWPDLERVSEQLEKEAGVLWRRNVSVLQSYCTIVIRIRFDIYLF